MVIMDSLYYSLKFGVCLNFPIQIGRRKKGFSKYKKEMLLKKTVLTQCKGNTLQIIWFQSAEGLCSLTTFSFHLWILPYSHDCHVWYIPQFSWWASRLPFFFLATSSMIPLNSKPPKNGFSLSSSQSTRPFPRLGWILPAGLPCLHGLLSL